MSELEEFGKDLGLIHQAVVTGRGIGADRLFWVCIAHNKELFQKLVGVVQAELELTPTDRQSVEKWITSLATKCPFEEMESYYANSSHCNYREYFENYHKTLSKLFWKGEHNPAAQYLCEEIECYFVLCYTYSAVYSAFHRKNVKWFHHPLWGLFVTFREVVDDDDRAPRGRFLTLEHFRANESVRMIKNVMETTQNTMENFEDLGDTKLCDILIICEDAKEKQRQKLITIIASIK